MATAGSVNKQRRRDTGRRYCDCCRACWRGLATVSPCHKKDLGAWWDGWTSTGRLPQSCFCGGKQGRRTATMPDPQSGKKSRICYRYSRRTYGDGHMANSKHQTTRWRMSFRRLSPKIPDNRYCWLIQEHKFSSSKYIGLVHKWNFSGNIGHKANCLGSNTSGVAIITGCANSRM